MTSDSKKGVEDMTSDPGKVLTPEAVVEAVTDCLESLISRRTYNITCGSKSTSGRLEQVTQFSLMRQSCRLRRHRDARKF